MSHTLIESLLSLGGCIPCTARSPSVSHRLDDQTYCFGQNCWWWLRYFPCEREEKGRGRGRNPVKCALLVE